MNIPPDATAQMLSEKIGMKEAFRLERKGKPQCGWKIKIVIDIKM
jgi:hypothetical protein